MRARASAALLAALLAGCGSTWQANRPVAATSYDAPKDAVPRYAGKLRRVALLPVVFETDLPRCRKLYPADIEDSIREEARRFLTDWKGYVVVEATQAAPSQDLQQLSAGLGQWQAKNPEMGRPPEELRARLQRLAARLNADGAIVLHGARECVTAGDVVLNLLVVGMPNFYGKLFGRNFSAGFYDAASGSLVWQRYMNMFGGDPPEIVRVTDEVEALLGGLENAIPEVLLR